MRHEYGEQRQWGRWHANISVDKSLKIARRLLQREDPRGPASIGMLSPEEWSALDHLVQFTTTTRKVKR